MGKSRKDAAPMLTFYWEFFMIISAIDTAKNGGTIAHLLVPRQEPVFILHISWVSLRFLSDCSRSATLQRLAASRRRGHKIQV